MKTNFKLHLATSKDSLRPVMQSILLTQKEFVATDAHVMAVVPNGIILEQDSISLIPEAGLLIDSQIWKSIYNADFIYLIEERGLKYIYAKFRNKPTLNFPLELNGENHNNFPKWHQVIPQEQAREEVLKLGINAKLLMNLADALDAGNGFKMEFNGTNKGVICTPINHNYKEVPYGLIMPIKVD
jgi:DNA polymerase III sliding clamp (beta) subunit (PCNA family)